MATPMMVTVCAPARPMTRPPRPAITAATSGSRGMAMSTCGFIAASASQGIQVFDVDAAPLAEQHDQDGEPDRRFRRRHGEHEEYEHLAVDIAQHPGEGDEVEVGGQQQQLHAHEEQDDVLAVEEDAGHREGEEHPREGEEVRQSDHVRFSASTLTMRTRSAARTDTWREISWTLRPCRRRMVREMAATIATRSSTAASSNGYA